jgi:hypothetical protein
MNHSFIKAVVLGALLLHGAPPAARAQDFSVDFFVVAGGGGSCAGGDFSLDGTFGQADANEQPLTGDVFSLTGGFWSLCAPSAPTNSTTNLVFFTVTPSAGAGGSITPSTPQTVVSNGGVSFTAAPADGFHIDQWLVDGSVAQTGGANFSLNDVAADAFVEVTFSINNSSVLNVLISGSGTIAPPLSGQGLLLSNTYLLTAQPSSGWVFSNWLANGVVVATTPGLTFEMAPNLVLQANFVPNPFAPATGAYQGLFYATNGVARQSSGFFDASVATTGVFSARLQMAAGAASFSGQFSLSGQFSNAIPGGALGALSAQLQLGLLNSTLTGQICGPNWTASLLANRAAFSPANPAPQAGRYTLLIPGQPGSSALPAGDGFGAVTVDDSGNVAFSGALADGTAAAASAILGGQGQWPFFVPLYSGQGSILGWLTFSNAPDSDISGSLNWIKPAQPTAGFYPAGFTNVTTASGSAYQFDNEAPILDYSFGQISFTGGDLAQSFANQVVLGAGGSFTNLSANALNLSLADSSGLLSGSVVDPSTGRLIPFSGVVLQKENFGAGFFLGTNQGGQVLLAPTP